MRVSGENVRVDGCTCWLIYALDRKDDPGEEEEEEENKDEGMESSTLGEESDSLWNPGSPHPQCILLLWKW